MSVAESVAGSELPKPDASYVLIRVFVEAYLSTAHLPRKERAPAFLQVASEILANEESVSLLLPIRPASEHAAVSSARRAALALYRQYLPVLLARVPRL